MKAKPLQIDALKDKIVSEYKAALLFGPDFSVINDCADKIIHMLLPKQEDFSLIKITKSQLKENPTLLIDEANTVSLWSNRRVIWLKDADNTHTEQIETFLQNVKTNAFLLLTADNLVKNASLRTLCENEKNVVAIACYEDSETDSRFMIRNILKTNGFLFSEEGLDLLVARLNENRLTTKNELEKLMTYMGEEKNITPSVIENIIPDIKNSTMESLCFQVADGEQTLADKSTDILLSNGETAVGITRALMQYFNKLLIGCDMKEKNVDFETISKKILRANQYMYKDKVFSQIRLWNKEMVLKVLILLNETEEQTKTTGIIPETVLHRSITMVAGLARKLKRNSF